MPLVISDEILHQAGLTEGDALLEFACRLFDADKITLWSAAKLAGLSRVAFEQRSENAGSLSIAPNRAIWLMTSSHWTSSESKRGDRRE